MRHRVVFACGPPPYNQEKYSIRSEYFSPRANQDHTAEDVSFQASISADVWRVAQTLLGKNRRANIPGGQYPSDRSDASRVRQSASEPRTFQRLLAGTCQQVALPTSLTGAIAIDSPTPRTCLSIVLRPTRHSRAGLYYAAPAELLIERLLSSRAQRGICSSANCRFLVAFAPRNDKMILHAFVISPTARHA
jgi:hypothetical protein